MRRWAQAGRRCFASKTNFLAASRVWPTVRLQSLPSAMLSTRPSWFCCTHASSAGSLDAGPQVLSSAPLSFVQPVTGGVGEERVAAHASSLQQERRWCSVLRQGGTEILGAEHLLAALECCGVDNARIEIEGGNGKWRRWLACACAGGGWQRPQLPVSVGAADLCAHVVLPAAELPIVDGSALGWASEVQRCGLRAAPAAADATAPRGIASPDEVWGRLEGACKGVPCI